MIVPGSTLGAGIREENEHTAQNGPLPALQSPAVASTRALRTVVQPGNRNMRAGRYLVNVDSIHTSVAV